MAVDAVQYNWKRITTQATFAVKAGAGVLHAIVINTKAASAVVTIYDDPAAANNPVGALDAASQNGTIFYDTLMVNGITIVMSGGSADITVVYK